MGVAGRRRPVALPGGPALDFALHLQYYLNLLLDFLSFVQTCCCQLSCTVFGWQVCLRAFQSSCDMHCDMTSYLPFYYIVRAAVTTYRVSI